MASSYRVFGDLTVLDDDGEEQVLTGRQAATLAVLLAARPDGVSRDRLIEQVWGEDLPADPEATLYSVVSRLRAVIGKDLLTTPSGYRVKTASVDSDRYEAAIAEARAAESLEAMQQAERGWSGDPYRGLDDVPDVVIERERLRRVRKWATRDRLELMMESGHSAAAADELSAAVSADPFDEETLALYMRALYDSGRKPAALRAFRNYEGTLAGETGLEPSAHLRELEVAILTDHLDSPASESRPLVPLDVDITYVASAQGGRIAVGRTGRGTPLLVHPGWMSKLDLLSSGLDMRTPMWAELAQRCEVVIFDRAGTGLSRSVPRAAGLEESVDELIAVMTSCFDGPTPVLAGSAAGPIAVAAAAKRPDLFSSIVFHGTYASGPEIFPREIANSLVALVKAGWGMGSEVLANLLFPSASTEVRNAWSETQREFADAETAAKLLRQMYDADTGDLLSQLDLPCLVIHYRQDKAVPVRGGEQLAREIPGARFVPLEGRTHYPLPGDEPKVAEIIMSFVEGRAVTDG
jgi:DNA-binding SARP family transcriptional activator/pimeloyl-ACP methyl ester carboxylesterase